MKAAASGETSPSKTLIGSLSRKWDKHSSYLPVPTEREKATLEKSKEHKNMRELCDNFIHMNGL